MQMQILFLFGVFLITVFIGVPIGYSIALATLVVLAGFTNTPLAMITQNCVSGVNSFSLMAIPFFILAGNLMSTGGVAKRIVNFADTCIGWITGGLSLVAFRAAQYGYVAGTAHIGGAHAGGNRRL